MQRGQRLFARLTPETRAGVRLAIWSPGTTRVEGLRVDLTRRVAQSHAVGGQVRVAYRAPETGIYYIEAKLVTQSYYPVQYRLSVARIAS